jgi:O-antigen/teichoic acid export membrane protein
MNSAKFSGERVAKALASSVVGQFVGVAQTFFLVPLFLLAWGQEGYGRWLSLTAVTANLALLELGGQSFVGNRLAAAFAKNETQVFKAVLSQGFSIFSVVAALAVLAVALTVMSPWLPLERNDRVVILCCSTATILGIPGGILACCYAATGRIVRGAVVGNCARLIQLGLSACALQARVSLPTYASVGLAISALGVAVYVTDLHFHLGDLFRPSISREHVRQGRSLLKGSVFYWIFPLAGALNAQGVLLIIAAQLGADSVAIYSTHRAAASLILYAAVLLRPALWTEMTFMVARSDIARLRELFSLALRANTWFAAIVAAGVCAAAPLGYALWTRSKLQLDLPLLIVLAVQAVLSAAWTTASWPLLSANLPRAVASWSLANGILTAAGSYITTKLGWGMRSVAMVSLLADLACGMLPFPVVACAFLQERTSRLVRDLLRALLSASPFAIAACMCFYAFSTDRARVIAYVVCCLALIWPTAVLLFGRDDLNRVWRAVRRRDHT